MNQIVRFLIVGSCSTAVNYAVFFFCLNVLHINYLLASGIGYFSGFGVGYVWNRNWTFSSHKALALKHRELIKYFIMNCISLTLSLLFLQFLVTVVHLPAWFSNILAIGLSTTTNFIGLKFFVFKAKSTV